MTSLRHGTDQEIAVTEISSFELEVDARDGGRRKYRFHRTGDDAKAKVSRREAGGERLVERGKRALEEAERLMAAIGLHRDMDRSQLLERTCSALLLHKDDIEYLDVEVAFISRTEIQAGIAGRHVGKTSKDTPDRTRSAAG